ncbi:MAG: Asp-tRNA(Asn)/Glu-tRNA(Gln) amidotransferase subunit GatB, partial [Planctomycetota bacterium]|nr:Asp-tRNA(Asn)/Glu-tRNA(Gln) amidotransferase subunit GatB [Planctomycetota bacterium]
MSDFETVIGLEVHVQLATKTKMFSGATCAFGQEPNTQVEPVSLGLPGSLPVINDHAVDLALKAALALGCDIHRRSKFDRKHYFYPDLPKGYQISQFDEPYCTGGGARVFLEDGSEKFIKLTRIHMEEDAGKLVHQDGGPWSEVDLNRAGTPLCEIVSEPDMCSPFEAYAFLFELRRAMKYCGVSDCEMQEGSLRCDANVSIRPKGQAELGTKVEVKNLNSFRAVEAAIAYEIEQQTALYRAGRYAEVVQETKLWDPNAKVTRSMRGKETSADYRYFPCPDLPPLDISDERLNAVRAEMPELPIARE